MVSLFGKKREKQENMNGFELATQGLGMIGSVGQTQMGIAADSNARRENYEYNEKAADNADKRKRMLYEEYQSPAAMVRQLEDAGLNPALMYSNGAGSMGAMTTGAQGGGATGTGTHGAGNMAQSGAETALALAKANEANANADAIRGYKKEESETRMGNNIANTNLTNAKTAGQELSNIGQTIDNYINSVRAGNAKELSDAQVTSAWQEIAKGNQILRKLSAEADMTEQNRDANIENIKLEQNILREKANLLMAQTIESKTAAALNEEERRKIQTLMPEMQKKLRAEVGETLFKAQRTAWESKQAYQDYLFKRDTREARTEYEKWKSLNEQAKQENEHAKNYIKKAAITTWETLSGGVISGWGNLCDYFGSDEFYEACEAWVLDTFH